MIGFATEVWQEEGIHCLGTSLQLKNPESFPIVKSILDESPHNSSKIVPSLSYDPNTYRATAPFIENPTGESSLKKQDPSEANVESHPNTLVGPEPSFDTSIESKEETLHTNAEMLIHKALENAFEEVIDPQKKPKKSTNTQVEHCYTVNGIVLGKKEQWHVWLNQKPYYETNFTNFKIEEVQHNKIKVKLTKSRKKNQSVWISVGQHFCIESNAIVITCAENK